MSITEIIIISLLSINLIGTIVSLIQNSGTIQFKRKIGGTLNKITSIHQMLNDVKGYIRENSLNYQKNYNNQQRQYPNGYRGNNYDPNRDKTRFQDNNRSYYRSRFDANRSPSQKPYNHYYNHNSNYDDLKDEHPIDPTYTRSMINEITSSKLGEKEWNKNENVLDNTIEENDSNNEYENELDENYNDDDLDNYNDENKGDINDEDETKNN